MGARRHTSVSYYTHFSTYPSTLSRTAVEEEGGQKKPRILVQSGRKEQKKLFNTGIVRKYLQVYMNHQKAETQSYGGRCNGGDSYRESGTTSRNYRNWSRGPPRPGRTGDRKKQNWEGGAAQPLANVDSGRKEHKKI